MGLMVNPPKPGDISYPKYATERLNILHFTFCFSAICIFFGKENYAKYLIYVSVYIMCSKLYCSKAILESMRRRACMMTDGFNSCRNVVCNFTEGKLKF
jgi:glutamate--glyoxylate aminotransferase